MSELDNHMGNYIMNINEIMSALENIQPLLIVIQWTGRNLNDMMSTLENVQQSQRLCDC